MNKYSTPETTRFHHLATTNFIAYGVNTVILKKIKKHKIQKREVYKPISTIHKSCHTPLSLMH